MLKSLRSSKGFTLIELMIVVAIIGILAAIAIPNFLTYQLKSRQSEARTNLGGIRTSEVSHQAQWGCYMSVSAAGAGAPVAGTKSTPVAWPVLVPAAAPTWCVGAAGAGVTQGNFADLGYASTGNVFFEYNVDHVAVAAGVPTAACQAAYASANVDAAAAAAFQAQAGANLDGDGTVGDFGVSTDVSVTQCRAASIF